MGKLLPFPVKRETKTIEDIYRREFGRVICQHGVYLPLNYCKTCDEREAKSLYKLLFGDNNAHLSS